MQGHEVDTVALRMKMAENHINTIKELSEKSGVNRDTCGSVLSGRAYPSSLVMEKFKVTLNMTPAQAGQIFFKEKLS